jgi:hypothetical protein
LSVAFKCEAGEVIIVCGIMSDAVRDLIDINRLNTMNDDGVLALLQAIERLVNLKHDAGKLEENGELVIRTSDLVRYGFGEPIPL